MTQPASTLRPPGAADFALLLLLALTWGSSFLFIKQAVETLPPLSLAVGRIAIGAAMLLAIAFAKGQTMPRDPGLWVRMVFLGIIGNSLPFFLIGWGEQYTPSNLAAILMATIPSFVIVLAHFFTHDEPLTLGKALGVNGGYVTANAAVIRFLRETSPMYIYSNPITPAEAKAALRSLELFASEVKPRL